MTRFSCGECQEFLYDVDWSNGCIGTGERKKHAGGTIETRRTKGCPPPCGQCPKESPAKEAEHVLTAANWQTWQLYKEVQATGGGCLTDEMKADAVLRQNLALIDGMAKARERQQLGREIAGRLKG